MLNEFENMRINFNGSILGFKELDWFVIEGIEETPFAYLRSVENSEVSFVVTSPFYWYADYELKVDENLKRTLDLDKEVDALVLGIITLKEPFELSTINLLAPLLINVRKQIGKQHVFHEQVSYQTNDVLIRNTEHREEES